MSGPISYSASDLGAVLIQARLQTSEVMAAFRRVEQHLQRQAIAGYDDTQSEQDRHRAFAAADFARSHLWSATFSASCYFAYLEIFRQLAEESSASDVKTAALDAAHIHADGVPVELYNAREILSSAEFMKLARIEQSDIRDCFERHFPGTKGARDAVAHSHDRLFARCYDRALAAEIGSRPISSKGKNFLGSDGHDFLFDFTIMRFRELLSDLDEMILRCA